MLVGRIETKSEHFTDDDIGEGFRYPDRIIEMVDALYDSGMVVEAEQMLDFLDSIGEQAVQELATLDTNTSRELPGCLSHAGSSVAATAANCCVDSSSDSYMPTYIQYSLLNSSIDDGVRLTSINLSMSKK